MGVSDEKEKTSRGPVCEGIITGRDNDDLGLVANANSTLRMTMIGARTLVSKRRLAQIKAASLLTRQIQRYFRKH